MVHLSSIACECHDSNLDSVYRKCCVSVGTNQTTYYYVLFDTGAHPFSFVSRKVAAWIGAHQQRRRRREEGNKGGGSYRALSLAGTTQTTPVYGCVEFDLTFVNEVTNEPETIFSIHAKIIDSCIDIIISRPVIRENHLVHKLPHYFDEVPRSRPYMSHSTLPVTPSCEFTGCISAISCATCPAFAAGYDTTLCSLTLEETDHPLVQQEQPRPLAASFADPWSSEGSHLIAKSELLGTLEDDDDIDWKPNPFDIRPDAVNPETPDELLALIQFEGSPDFQEKLRSLCREFIDVFSTSVRSRPANVEPMEIVVDRLKWRHPAHRLPPRRHSSEKQAVIRTQTEALLKLGVIEESRATEWSQVHLVPKPNPNEWRFTLDFVRLNACTGGLEGWPIPNILKVLERIGTLKPRLFGLIDFTAGYHQTPLHPNSRDLSAFITADGLYQWTRVAMGLKGAGPYFQRSMASKVLAGLIYRICELYIDDVLIHGSAESDFLVNLRKVFLRLREHNVAANPRKTKLGLTQVEYVGHLISAEGTSFTDEKRLKVLNFPLPQSKKALLQFLGLGNYFRDHVPNMTELCKPLRDMCPTDKSYRSNGKLEWTPERIHAFEKCQQAISNCQELYFLEDTATPIVQTDASDYGIGGYVFMVTNGKVRVIRYFSKALQGAQLNWSAREKECYAIYYGIKQFEDLLDNRHFILKTDHKNLTYINVTLTGKVLRWKLYLQDKDFHLMHVPGKEVHQFVPDALFRLCENNMPPKVLARGVSSAMLLAALEPSFHIPSKIFNVISEVHNTKVGHHGLHMCKKRLKDKGHVITDRMITQFIRQCPCCQVMNRLRIPIKTHPFTCASYNPFEVIHLDHIGPLKTDDKGHQYILVLIDAFSRWVELFPTTSVSAYETASCLFQHFGRFGTPSAIHTDRGTAFHNELVEELTRLAGTDQSLSTAYSKEENGIVERANQEVLRHLTAILFDTRVSNAWSYEQLPMVQRIMNTVEKTSTGVTPAELVLTNSIRLVTQRGRYVLLSLIHI